MLHSNKLDLAVLDKQGLEDLKEDLEVMMVSRAWVLVQDRLELLLSRDRQLREAEGPIESLRVLQGRVRAEVEIMNLIPDLVNEVSSLVARENE